MTFGTSAYLDWRFSTAQSDVVLPVIAPLLQELGGSDTEILDFSRRFYRHGELEELREWTHRIQGVTASTVIAASVKKFWAAQALAVPVFSREPVSDEPLDPVAVRMLRVGANSLFEAGRLQFQTLRLICQRIVEWFKARPQHEMVLLESPLGNCVPVAVALALAKQASVNVSVVTWNAPRNDRPAAGYTVKESAKALISNLNEKAILVFIDDAITGTRFVKTYDALQKVRKEKVLPVALVFPDLLNSNSGSNQILRLKTRMTTAAAGIAYPETLVEMPALPSFRIDDGLPVIWSSPVIWGEADLTAGKRKVNLLFNLLEHLVIVLNDLAENGRFVRYLEKAWQTNADGERFVFYPGLLEGMFQSLTSKVRLDELVKTLVKLGRERFPNDFTGDLYSISQSDVKTRWDWFREEFLRLAEEELKPGEAALLWRAFDNTFAASQGELKPRPSRDHVYATYALRYNKTLYSFHAHLVALISQVPEC